MTPKRKTLPKDQQQDFISKKKGCQSPSKNSGKSTWDTNSIAMDSFERDRRDSLFKNQKFHSNNQLQWGSGGGGGNEE